MDGSKKSTRKRTLDEWFMTGQGLVLINHMAW